MNRISCVHFLITAIFLVCTTSTLATTHPHQSQLSKHQNELDEKLSWKERAALWVTSRKWKKRLKSKNEETEEYDRTAIIALPVGLLSLVAIAVIFPLNILLALVAIYLGFLSLRNIRKFGRRGKFLALLGIVLGISALILTVHLGYLLYVGLFL